MPDVLSRRPRARPGDPTPRRGQRRRRRCTGWTTWRRRSRSAGSVVVRVHLAAEAPPAAPAARPAARALARRAPWLTLDSGTRRRRPHGTRTPTSDPATRSSAHGRRRRRPTPSPPPRRQAPLPRPPPRRAPELTSTPTSPSGRSSSRRWSSSSARDLSTLVLCVLFAVFEQAKRRSRRTAAVVRRRAPDAVPRPARRADPRLQGIAGFNAEHARAMRHARAATRERGDR